jgi:hypothetical protein
MNSKDLFDFINANFTMRSNSVCYNKLNCFVDAMHRGQYYPITDEEIHRGVEYKKAEGKALIKSIGTLFAKEDQVQAEALLEACCNQCLQQFLKYNHTYEKQNNRVI